MSVPGLRAALRAVDLARATPGPGRTAHHRETGARREESTMEAAVGESFTAPLVVEDRPVPAPAGRQVLVRMETSGLCHTDVHAAHGDWPARPSPPFVPGHEGVGIVEAAGARGRHLSVGDRIAVPRPGSACGRCDFCVRGWEGLCLQQADSGHSVGGSHADYPLADGGCVVPVPEGIDPLDAAPLTCAGCAGLTMYKAVKVLGSRPGSRVLVSGIGGLGHLALQYARISGTETIAVDITDEKLALARELGADHVLDARIQDVADEVRRLADDAISLTVSDESHLVAHRALRPHSPSPCPPGTLSNCPSPQRSWTPGR